MLTVTRPYALFSGLLVAALAVSTIPTHANDARVLPTLAGVWKAQEMRVPASSELDQQVWGKHAYKVRNIQLALEAGGTGTLRVESAVVDASGKPKKFSRSVVEARLQVNEPKPGNDRVQPEVTVVSAEERFPDDPKDSHTITGLRLRLDQMTLGSPQLNIFYETPEGNGSFGETLRRQGGARPVSATSHVAAPASQPRG